MADDSAPPHSRGRFRAPDPAVPTPARQPRRVGPPAGPGRTPAAHPRRRGPLVDGPHAGESADREPPRDEAASDRTAPAGDRDPDAGLVRDTGSMAIATLISRVTGFLKTILILAVLGKAVASAFNVANTLPNMITEIVLGAVLTALVVPVLVRAEKEDGDGGRDFVRRLFTLSAAVLGGVTLLAMIGAPLLTRMMLDADGKVNVSLSTAFAWLLLPQITFYGLSALLMAVLNTKGVFRPGAWAPVWNNLVVLGVFVIYWFIPGAIDPDSAGSITDIHVLVLGVGTTLGVVVQALVLIPALRRAGIDLRPKWGVDDRIRQFGGMGLAIIVYVAISQLGFVVTNRIASGADSGGPSIYQTMWLLLQVPYGILGVTLLTAIMPRLSRNAADDDREAVVRDLTVGTKLTMIALLPIIVFMTAFGAEIANALFAYGRFSSDDANILGLTLSYSAFTLVPYALVLLHLRVFYAREEAWTPTFIIVGITVTKVLLSYVAPLLVDPQHVVVILGAANGFGFVTGAVVGAVLLRRSLGHLHGREIVRTVVWVTAASVVGSGIAWIVDEWVVAPILPASLGSIGFVVRVAVAGVLMLALTGLVLWRSGLPELAAILARFRGGRPEDEAAESDRDGYAGRQDMGERMVAHMGDRRFDDRVESSVSDMSMTGEFQAMPPIRRFSPRPLRGPRLVPGAVVGGGRYRLLASHGGAHGMGFWHARDTHLERDVALTFVDPTQSEIDALGGATRESGAQRILTRTLALARIRSAGLARVLDVVRDSSGGFIVAEWTPGSPLRDVAASLPDPRGSALAVHHLAGAAEEAHRAGTALSIDHPDRIRISSEGAAVLAFPGTLEDADARDDIRGIGRVLYALVTDRWPAGGTTAPADGGPAAPGTASASADAGDEDRVGGFLPALRADGTVVPARRVRPEVPWEISEIAARAIEGGEGGLRTAGAVENLLDQASVADEDTELISLPDGGPATDPDIGIDAAAAADGARPPLVLSLIAVAVVVVLALVLWAFMSLFGGGANQSTPWERLSPSPTTSAPAGEAPSAAPAGFTGARGFPIGDARADGGTPGNAIDGDSNTAWDTSGYYQYGIVLDLPEARDLAGIRLTTTAPGMSVEVRSAESGNPAAGSGTPLTSATLTEGDNEIGFPQPVTTGHIIIWIAGPGTNGAVTISEVAPL